MSELIYVQRPCSIREQLRSMKIDNQLLHHKNNDLHNSVNRWKQKYEHLKENKKKHETSY